MIQFELGIKRPNPRRALQSALTIAAAYVASGLIPFAPYIVIPRARIALAFSVIVTAAALIAFRIRERTLHRGSPRLRSAL
jgi:vacuolar iron transporter family protein